MNRMKSLKEEVRLPYLSPEVEVMEVECKTVLAASEFGKSTAGEKMGSEDFAW